METLNGRGVKELENDSEVLATDRNLKRMYSYRQLFDLHKILNNNSDVHDRVTKNEEDIRVINQDLIEVRNLIKNLRWYTDNEIKTFKGQMAEEKEEQENNNKDHKGKLTDHKA